MNGNPRANGSRGHDPYAALRLVALIAAITGVIVLAAAAFVLSYGGIHKIALSAGVSASMARIVPVIFDAMLVVSCAAVLSLRAANWWHRAYAWLTALVLLAAVAAADAVHATGTHIPRKPAAATIAVLPWVLLLLAFSLLLSMLRQFRRARAAEGGQDVTGNAGLAAPAPGSTAPDSREPGHTAAGAQWAGHHRGRAHWAGHRRIGSRLPARAGHPGTARPVSAARSHPDRYPAQRCPPGPHGRRYRARARERPDGPPGGPVPAVRQSRVAQSRVAQSRVAQSRRGPVPGGPVPGGPVPGGPVPGGPVPGGPVPAARTPNPPAPEAAAQPPGAPPPGTAPAGAQPAHQGNSPRTEPGPDAGPGAAARANGSRPAAAEEQPQRTPLPPTRSGGGPEQQAVPPEPASRAGPRRCRASRAAGRPRPRTQPRRPGPAGGTPADGARRQATCQLGQASARTDADEPADQNPADQEATGRDPADQQQADQQQADHEPTGEERAVQEQVALEQAGDEEATTGPASAEQTDAAPGSGQGEPATEPEAQPPAGGPPADQPSGATGGSIHVPHQPMPAPVPAPSPHFDRLRSTPTPPEDEPEPDA